MNIKVCSLHKNLFSFAVYHVEYLCGLHRREESDFLLSCHSFVSAKPAKTHNLLPWIYITLSCRKRIPIYIYMYDDKVMYSGRCIISKVVRVLDRFDWFCCYCRFFLQKIYLLNTDFHIDKWSKFREIQYCLNCKFWMECEIYLWEQGGQEPFSALAMICGILAPLFCLFLSAGMFTCA